MTSFNLNYLLKDPIFITVTWGLELQPMDLGGHESVYNSSIAKNQLTVNVRVYFCTFNSIPFIYMCIPMPV